MRKGKIKPQETPCSQASTPKTRVPTLLFYALTYTSDFMGGCSPTTSLGEGVNLQLLLLLLLTLQSCPTLCNPIDGSPPGSCPWDSLGKNTGVGCHFFLQCMEVKSESEVTVMSDSS